MILVHVEVAKNTKNVVEQTINLNKERLQDMEIIIRCFYVLNIYFNLI